MLPTGASAQANSSPRWVFGEGSAEGTDIALTKTKALLAARSDALKQVGITLRVSELLAKSESNSTISDFYSQFAESSTRGLILEERNISFGELEVIRGTDLVRIRVSLEARIALQQGEPDPGFQVSLVSDRESYEENEPVRLSVTSTRDGYLTLFYVENDSLNVLLPSAVIRSNQIEANKTLHFPPNDVVSLHLLVQRGQKASAGTFIAVVTKDDVPFPNLAGLEITETKVKLKQDVLTAYNQWLYRIGVDRRSSDHKLVQVTAKR
jgi:hypothetical protein